MITSPGVLLLAAFVTVCYPICLASSLCYCCQKGRGNQGETAAKLGGADAVYASITGLIGNIFEKNFDSKHSEWSVYFWNRGLEMEPCTYPGV